MYVGRRKRGMGRLARANRLSSLRGAKLGRMSLAEANRIVDQRLGQLLYTDSSGNVWSDPGYVGPGSPSAVATPASTANPWASIITTGITTAGAVAAKAVTPPTYSSTINPLTGAQTITSYGATVPSSLLTSGLTTDLSSLLESPIVLIGGIALFALMMLRR